MVFNPENSWTEALNFWARALRNSDFKISQSCTETAALECLLCIVALRLEWCLIKTINVYLKDWHLLIFKVIKSGNLYFPILFKLNCELPRLGKKRKMGLEFGWFAPTC